LNTFTKTVAKIAVFALLNFALCYSAMGQNNALSLASSGVTAGWATVDLGVVPNNNNVTIMAGDTISLDTLGNCAKLTIQKGATLNSVSNAASGRLVGLLPGANTEPGLDTIQNDGVFGSASEANDGIAIAIPATCSNIKLMGTGVTAIGAMLPASHNSSLIFDLAQNASLNNKGIAFTAHPVIDSNSTADNITFNIDTGITLRVINPNGQVQGASADGKGGIYTYNIYGTLDLSATTATQNFAPYSASPASVITANISGDLKLGTGFSSVSAGTGGGKAIFNILNGGLVDATNTTQLSMGINYFITNGSGVLKRRVTNSTIVFPVGVPGGLAFNPVALNNKGVANNFSVSVSSKFVQSLPPNSTGSNVTVSPVWLTADEATGFNPALAVSVVSYNGSSLVKSPAIVSGLGINTNPYVATAPGFTTFGLFGVENTTDAPAMQVFPNPTAKQLTLSFPETIVNGTVTITTQSGQKIIVSKMDNGGNWSGDVSSFLPGVYIITLQNGGKFYSQKFIKM
jgi:hypothetical protein